MLDASKFVWTPLSLAQPYKDRFLSKLRKELLSWEGTPYRENTCVKGMGVDCVRFVCAVLDHMQNGGNTDLPFLPQDASLHSPTSAKAAMRLIKSLYGPNYAVKDYTLEPGDVIVAGPEGGGPGHALIVGDQPNQIWHSTGRRVHRTGMSFYKTTAFPLIFRVYRHSDRRDWIY